jgi:PhnB protein
MSNAVPVGWHTVTPRLVAHDAAKLVRFLKDAFGAIGDYRADMPSVVTVGDSILMVSEAGMRSATSSFFYLYVEDTDEVYRKALEAGAVSVEEPAKTPYGDRRAMVTDPCGNDWQIATYAGQLRAQTQPL